MGTKIRFEQPVYSFNIDSNRHVSNLTYIEWMEIARINMLDAVGLPLSELKNKGFAPILCSTCIDYKKPLMLGDQVEVEIWLSTLNRISATMEIRFYRNGDELVASGCQKGLFVSLESGRPYRLSDEDREPFTRYLVENSQTVCK